MRTTVFTVIYAVALFGSRAKAQANATVVSTEPLAVRAVPTCEAGLTYSTKDGKCVDVLNDAAHCGTVNHACYGGLLTDGESVCRAGVCQAVCNSGFGFDREISQCVDIQSDAHNCGSVGHICGRPLFSVATCTQGACTFQCQKGYDVSTADSSQCIRTTKMPERKKARKSKTSYQLCPSVSETACPIAGSASFSSELARRLPQLKYVDQTVLARDVGGYECLDVTSSVDSCGGCSSLGEGKDCTKLAHSVGVGCEASKCVVFTCEAGYQPSLQGDACVAIAGHKAHGKHGRRRVKRNLHVGIHSHDR